MDTEINDSMELSKTHSPLHEASPFLPYNDSESSSREAFQDEVEKSKSFHEEYVNETSIHHSRYSPLPPPSKLSTSTFDSTSISSSYSIRGVSSSRTASQQQHSNNNNSSSSPPFPKQPPPVIQVSYGCLLLPVFLAAWWYYTKSVCRKVAHGFIRSTAHTEQDELETYEERLYSFSDCYAQWEDSVHQSESNESTHSSASDRFVKWINRSNVHRRFQKKHIQVKTNEYLFGRTTTYPTTAEEKMSTAVGHSSRTNNNENAQNNNNNNSGGGIEMTITDKDIDTNINNDGQRNSTQQQEKQQQQRQSSQWECLPDISGCYCILQLPPTVGATAGSGSGEEAIYDEVGNNLVATNNSRQSYNFVANNNNGIRHNSNNNDDDGGTPQTTAAAAAPQFRRYNSMPVRHMPQQQQQQMGMMMMQQKHNKVGNDIITIQQLDPKGIAVNNSNEHNHQHQQQQQQQQQNQQQYPGRSTTITSDRSGGLQMKGFPALADGMMA